MHACVRTCLYIHFNFNFNVHPVNTYYCIHKNALRRIRVAFEFFVKLGVPYYTFHDVDVCPLADTIDGFNANMDIITDELEAQQKKPVCS